MKNLIPRFLLIFALAQLQPQSAPAHISEEKPEPAATRNETREARTQKARMARMARIAAYLNCSQGYEDDNGKRDFRTKEGNPFECEERHLKPRS